MSYADVLAKWHWRDGRTIASREVIELLDKVVERGAPVMANKDARHMFKFAIHRGTRPFNYSIGPAASRADASAPAAR